MTAGVFKSVDGAATWTNVCDVLPPLGIATLAVGHDIVYAGTKGAGVFAHWMW